MIDFTPIRLAMRQRLLAAKDVSHSLPKPINLLPASWDNREFNPPNPPELWFRETWLPSTEQKVATGVIRLSGIFQYDAFDAAGKGTTNVDNLALIIANAFPPSTSVHGAGVQIDIVRCERGRGGESSKRTDQQVWYSVPVRVTILVHQFVA